MPNACSTGLPAIGPSPTVTAREPAIRRSVELRRLLASEMGGSRCMALGSTSRAASPTSWPWPQQKRVYITSQRTPWTLEFGVTDTCLGRGTYLTRTRTIQVGRPKHTQSPRVPVYRALRWGVPRVTTLRHATPHVITLRHASPHTSCDPRRYTREGLGHRPPRANVVTVATSTCSPTHPTAHEPHMDSPSPMPRHNARRKPHGSRLPLPRTPCTRRTHVRG